MLYQRESSKDIDPVRKCDISRMIQCIPRVKKSLMQKRVKCNEYLINEGQSCKDIKTNGKNRLVGLQLGGGRGGRGKEARREILSAD